jgi:hypothetical protein
MVRIERSAENVAALAHVILLAKLFGARFLVVVALT